jgi:hypothetical protein
MSVRTFGVVAVTRKSVSELIIFTRNKRHDLRGDIETETAIRAIDRVDGAYRIAETFIKSRGWIGIRRRTEYEMKVIDPNTIAIWDGKKVTRYAKCVDVRKVWIYGSAIEPISPALGVLEAASVNPSLTFCAIYATICMPPDVWHRVRAIALRWAETPILPPPMGSMGLVAGHPVSRTLSFSKKLVNYGRTVIFTTAGASAVTNSKLDQANQPTIKLMPRIPLTNANISKLIFITTTSARPT